MERFSETFERRLHERTSRQSPDIAVAMIFLNPILQKAIPCRCKCGKISLVVAHSQVIAAEYDRLLRGVRGASTGEVCSNI